MKDALISADFDTYSMYNTYLFFLQQVIKNLRELDMARFIQLIVYTFLALLKI